MEELATIGEQIAIKGAKLKEMREEREALSTVIKTLEEELTPLVQRHTEIVAGIVGKPAAPVPVVAVPGGNNGSGDPKEDTLRNRVIAYLEDKSNVSAFEVSEALSVSPAIVREAMRAMAAKR